MGLSTRGRNTADAQFFINLVDNPRLNTTTRCSRSVVAQDMAVVDKIQEGDVMRSHQSEQVRRPAKIALSRPAGSSSVIVPAVASISTCGPDRQRPLRLRVADHRALPRRHAERLDVVVEDLLQRQRAVVPSPGPHSEQLPNTKPLILPSTPGELQLRHHPIDAIEILADVLAEQDRIVPVRHVGRAEDGREHA